jgi:lactate dehydrogenase-like 2-hydroxyacid dehydrogenase
LSKPDILAVASLHPLYQKALEAVYTVHDRTHETDPAAFAALAPRIVGVAANGESRVTRELLQQLPQAKVVSVFGVGYDGVDVAAALQTGIRVGHTPDVLTDDVADLAMGLLLSIGRNIPQADQFVRHGQWAQGGFRLSKKVSGSRLGIVGLGRIGKAIAQRASAFGMQIAYTARSEKTGSGYTYVPNAEALAAQVDFLVVITPGGAGTRHLINADVLKALGPKGFLINVARGSVVDEDALLAALQSGTIAGAAIDVYANEPHVPEAFWSLQNVVLTPHMASATHETRQAMADLAFANMQAGTAGQPLRTPVPEWAERNQAR